MKNALHRALALSMALFCATPAFAGVPLSDIPNQATLIYIKLPDGTYAPLAGDASANGSVVGTFSATLSGFNATAGATANLTDLVNVSQDVALPAGADVLISNKGSVTINFRMQAGAGTAVSTDLSLVAGAAMGQHITTQTHISAIAPTGTATGATAGQLNIQGGTGLVAGYGGGSSGGGTSGAVTNAGTFAVQAAQSGTWTVQPGNTANTTAWKVDGSAVTQPVSVATIPSHAVTNAGTFAVQATLAAGSALAGKVGIDQTTPGTTNGVYVTNNGTAIDTAIAGQTPSTIACQRLSATPTAATTATTGPVNCTVNGYLVTTPYALPDNWVNGVISSAMTGTTSTSLVSAGGSGLKVRLTTLVCSNGHATQGTDILIQDGSGGTTLFIVPAAAVYGGTAISFPVPLPGNTANTAIFAQNVTTGASTKCSAIGFKGP